MGALLLLQWGGSIFRQGWGGQGPGGFLIPLGPCVHLRLVFGILQSAVLVRVVGSRQERVVHIESLLWSLPPLACLRRRHRQDISLGTLPLEQ